MLSFISSKLIAPRLHAQKWRRYYQAHAWDFRKLQNAFPQTICIDVGASYFAHTAWWFFLETQSTRWIAVDPNENNLDYSRFWLWKAKLQLVKTGLSEFGGPMTLYKTNIDSGSSFLKPILHESISHRYTRSTHNYFFPIQEIQIETKPAAEIVSQFEVSPIIIKLDTQGSELSIVRGLLESSSQRMVVGIEIECSLYSLPQYEDSPRFWEIAEYLESKGFELLNLDVFPSRKSSSKYKANSRNISGECDALFALRRDLIDTLSSEMRCCLLGFYITNAFYHEALSLLIHDQELCSYLRDRNFEVNDLTSLLRRR
jgi:FkbM family methyltransferase